MLSSVGLPKTERNISSPSKPIANVHNVFMIHVPGQAATPACPRMHNNSCVDTKPAACVMVDEPPG
jgi:hypothetical protein